MPSLFYTLLQRNTSARSILMSGPALCHRGQDFWEVAVVRVHSSRSRRQLSHRAGRSATRRRRRLPLDRALRACRRAEPRRQKPRPFRRREGTQATGPQPILHRSGHPIAGHLQTRIDVGPAVVLLLVAVQSPAANALEIAIQADGGRECGFGREEDFALVYRRYGASRPRARLALGAPMGFRGHGECVARLKAVSGT